MMSFLITPIALIIVCFVMAITFVTIHKEESMKFSEAFTGFFKIIIFLSAQVLLAIFLAIFISNLLSRFL
jgi:hypothetical protein